MKKRVRVMVEEGNDGDGSCGEERLEAAVKNFGKEVLR
jgi:hypothetical protein